MKVQIEDKFIQAKTGNFDDCEDAIFIGDYYFAVIDGATSKDGKKWGQYTGGQLISHLLCCAFSELNPDLAPQHAVHFLTDFVWQYYNRQNCVTETEAYPQKRIIASVVAINLKRKEVWSVGDCYRVIGSQVKRHPRMGDQICANLRAMYLELEVLNGKTIAELRLHDTGREYILPILKQQAIFHNNPKSGDYWCPVIDGFPVPAAGIAVDYIREHDKTVILASDGYPVLKPELSESENALQYIINEDPLLFRKCKELKCVIPGNLSFDDRSFLKLSLS